MCTYLGQYLCYNTYVIINYLPLIRPSNFISIMQALLGITDLQGWVNHNSKVPKFSASAVY